MEESFIVSGNQAIDEALGGGYPSGKLIELFGSPNTGKRTIALEACKQQGSAALWLELGGSDRYDEGYAKRIGWVPQTITFTQPNISALHYLERAIRTGIYRLIVVTASELFKAPTGVDLRVLSQQVRKLCSVADATRTTIIFLSDRLPHNPYQDDAPMLSVLKYYCGVRVHLLSSQWHHRKKSGLVGQGQVVKHKWHPPFNRFPYEILHSNGLVKPRHHAIESYPGGLSP